VTEEMAESLLDKAGSLGCRSVHIGGGEPFLDLEGLLGALSAARRAGVGIDYIETNSSWFKDKASAVDALRGIRAAGAGTLLVSISPFHNERIPFAKVEGVVAACREAGVSVFPWIAEFADEISKFDKERAHRLEEYAGLFGVSYVSRLAARYSLVLRGRALRTFKDAVPAEDLDTVLERSAGGCRELSDTFHFHLDLYGGYLPGLCAGLSIDYRDLGVPLPEERYPVISALASKGVSGLLEMAVGEHSFEPKERYFSKCDLCEDIRRFLALERSACSNELRPREFYEEGR
jgi:hypothetical protein